MPRFARRLAVWPLAAGLLAVTLAPAADPKPVARPTQQ